MGESFSGYERNCGYLNIGGTEKQFANVSAISGFDFPDDARAVAMLDWDHDGDLDAWVKNRTAPRVRFLRNEGESGNHFLAIALEGRSCNRDAIGARVEVVVAPSHDDKDGEAARDLKLVKTRRAGEGFATQSSQWVHFGLGQSDAIERVDVRWPGGETESFAGLSADSWYRLVQGTGKADRWTPPNRVFRLAASEPKAADPAGQTRSIIACPAPLPQLTYTTLRGEVAGVGVARDRPLLLNLWSSDCLACQAELKEFGAEQDRFRSAGLDVVAICVDAFTAEAKEDDDSGVDAVGAREILDRLGYPFGAGMANAEFFEKLHLTIDQLYIRDIAPAVPLSVLLNRDGHITVIYRGRVGLDQILADVEDLSLTGQPLTGLAARNVAVPLPGRWILSQYRKDSHMSRIASALSSQGFKDDSIQYVEQNLSTAKDDPRYGRTLVAVAGSLFSKEEYARSEAKYREAVEFDPQDIEAVVGLARALVAQFKHAEAIPVYRKVIGTRPDDVESLVSLGVSLQFANQPEKAIPIYEKALAIDPKHGRAHLFMAKYLRYNDRLDEAMPHFHGALAADPDSDEIHYELGMALLQKGDLELAREHLLKGVQGDLKNNFINQMNNRAWLLATRESSRADERREAVILGEIITELTGHKLPQLLDTLAVAYAAYGLFAEAIATEKTALELAAKKVETPGLIDALRERLQMFLEKRPYYELRASN